MKLKYKLVPKTQIMKEDKLFPLFIIKMGKRLNGTIQMLGIGFF